MAIRNISILAGVAVLGTIMALAASAEISGVREGVVRAGNADPLRVMTGEALRLQCWQNGIQIIDEVGLAGVSVKSLLKPETLLLGGGGEAARVVVLSLEESTCL
ncbi:MAG: hypothetical protein ACTSWM_10330, partial [Alphaproteobacteria bacterium]